MPEHESVRYRVFVSYSHEDYNAAEKVVNHLKEIRCEPKWDEGFNRFHGFPEQIRLFIAHAHAFLPLITVTSSQRGWVHQEIGFAIAHNIPMMPIVIGEALPDKAMMRDIQAAVLNENLDGLEEVLTREEVQRVVRRHSDRHWAVYQCAETMLDRTRMLAEWADQVRDLFRPAAVRQKGALSSFHIPDKRLTHRVWKDRYAGFSPGEKQCRLHLDERRALTEHAKACPTRIIVDPSLSYDRYGPAARASRLASLLEFLESRDARNVQVAVNTDMPPAESLTLVGDWFAAEAISGAERKGYRHTNFTRHAPSIHRQIEMFDNEFDELLAEAGWTAKSSRSMCIRLLKKELAEGRRQTRNTTTRRKRKTKRKN